VFDQIGYGFHRYSTDAAWKVPHFEKMLYDQALLLRAYTEAMGPHTAAYVCTDFQCKAPIHTASELEDHLVKLDKNTRNK
jgi:uncharacterized protein YyaL (SSP411 family)